MRTVSVGKKTVARKSCSTCIYAQESLNLLWCRRHKDNRTALELCVEWEEKFEWHRTRYCKVCGADDYNCLCEFFDDED